LSRGGEGEERFFGRKKGLRLLLGWPGRGLRNNGGIGAACIAQDGADEHVVHPHIVITQEGTSKMIKLSLGEFALHILPEVLPVCCCFVLQHCLQSSLDGSQIQPSRLVHQ